MVAGGLGAPRAVARRRRHRRAPAATARSTWVAREVLGAVRRAKTEAKKGLRAPIASATVTGAAAELAAFEAVRADVMEAANIAELTTVEGAELAVAVTLAEG